ncbi:MAG: DUF1015 domain-containing protein, partial [Nitrospiria bacterium]
MVAASPFRGILYDPERVSDLQEVVTPPYDVITPEAQENYYRRNEYNVIRLDLGKEAAGDGPANNKYTRAAAYFRDWQRQGILKQDEHPALYRYEITYSTDSPGQKRSKSESLRASRKTLRGCFGAVRLETYSSGRILPHEDTFPKVKEDRLNLLRACRANFSPIFTLYLDPEDRIQRLLEQGSSQNPPRIDFVNEDHTHHRMWSVADPALIHQIHERFSPQNLLIADGHHRYETALAFREEYPQADHMLMFLVNMKDPGLSLLAIHRLLHGLPAERVERLLKDLPQYFHIHSDIRDLANLQERMQEIGKIQPTLGLYTHKGDFLLLNPKSEGLQLIAARLNLPAMSTPLDVNLLDPLILEDLLNLRGGAKDRETHLLYIKDAGEGVEKVKRGEVQMAFFLNPVKIEVVQNLARKGIKMPHKSTYFYPKPLSGL